MSDQSTADAADPDDLRARADSLHEAGRYHTAVRTYERLLELRPDADPKAYNYLTKSYAHLGLLDRAEERVRDLYLERERRHPDPFWSLRIFEMEGQCLLAVYATFRGDSAAAMAHADSMIALAEPGEIFPGPPNCVSKIEARWGDYDDAALHLQQLLATDLPSPLLAVPYLALATYVERQRGHPVEAERFLSRAHQMTAPIRQADEAQLRAVVGDLAPFHALHYQLARIATLRDQEEQAVRHLREAYEAGDLRHLWWTELDPVLDPLTDREDFQALIRELEAETSRMRRVLLDG